MHGFGKNKYVPLKAIQQATAADVVKVKRERCDYCKDGTSFIGAIVFMGNDSKFHKFEYCPNCGAKMDGGK